MKLKDYIHYYMGATYWTDNSQGEVNKVTLQHIYPMIEKGKNVQLHLRRLEDMTEGHKSEIGKALGQPEEMVDFLLIKADRLCDHRLGPSAYFKIVPYLLQQGFDLFGLIDAGLAIDLKTLTP